MSVISAVRHLASYASRNMERNGFNVKVVSMFIAVTRMHSLEGTLCSTVQIVSTKVQGVEILTARASLSITNKTKKQMGGDFIIKIFAVVFCIIHPAIYILCVR